MEVKSHAFLAGLTEPDPAEYAIRAGLVGVHDPWVFGVVGAWRWGVIQKHKDRIKELVTRGYTIDLGGGAAPVGYGAVVVDYQAPFPNGPRSLCDVPGGADCVFCSHTLEHFVDVDCAMSGIAAKLKAGGALIVQVPSWRKQHLNRQRWAYHEQDFCFRWEKNAPAHVVRLEDLLERYGFGVDLVDEDATGNYLIVGVKR